MRKVDEWVCLLVLGEEPTSWYNKTLHYFLFPHVGTDSDEKGQTADRLGHTVREASFAMARRLLSELIGTFFLVFFHAGLRIQQHRHNIDSTAHGLGAGLTLVALIYAFGEVGGVSGTHQ